MVEYKSVKISKKNYELLNRFKIGHETFDEVLTRLFKSRSITEEERSKYMEEFKEMFKKLNFKQEDKYK